MEEQRLYLLLGCFGRRDDDFISCGGVENNILTVEDHLIHYNEMMNYFDTCRLFDRPMFDLNAIRHFIFNLREKFDQLTKRLWPEKKFDLYQKFIIEHRYCGLYVKLVLAAPLEIKEIPEAKGILIPASKETDISEPVQGKLRIVRGLK